MSGRSQYANPVGCREGCKLVGDGRCLARLNVVRGDIAIEQQLVIWVLLSGSA